MKRHQRINRGIFSTITAEVDTTKSPCKLMPEFWDAPKAMSGARYAPGEQSRSLAAAKECQESCAELAACLRFVKGWSHPDGVIAGQVWRDGQRLA